MAKTDDVGPTTLLIAIVPFLTTPLTGFGPWRPHNTVLAGVVLTVLVAYTCVGDRRRFRPTAERVAIGAVIGLVAAIASAYPLQSLFAGELDAGYPPQFDENDPHVYQATWSSLLVGLVVAVVVFRLLRYDAPDTEAPDTDTPDTPTGSAWAPDTPTGSAWAPDTSTGSAWAPAGPASTIDELSNPPS